MAIAISNLGATSVAAERLDPSFGGDGRVVTDFSRGSDVAEGIAIYQDGKIVAAGTSNDGGDSKFAVARYNPDGTRDASFSADGRVTTDFAEGGPFDFPAEQAYDVLIDDQGRVVVVGNAGFASVIAIARYNDDGTLDTSFDGDGRVTTDFASNPESVEYGVAIAAQDDGKIVVAADLRTRFGLARYNDDGTLDVSFGGDGVVTTNFDPGHEEPSDLAIQSDGKIVVVGHSQFTRFLVVRFDPDGTLDTAFGENGEVHTNFSPTGREGAAGVVLQGNGKIVAAGGARGVFALARYLPGGRLDPNFGGDGKVRTNFTPRVDAAEAGVGIDPLGRIVAAGFAKGGRKFAIARYRRDGTLDDAFGGDGKVTTHFYLGPASALAMAIQLNGGIVAAGTVGAGLDTRFALARYRGR